MAPDAPTPNPSPATHTWELDEDDDRAPCPMGCGNLTDDVAGGPCSAGDDVTEQLPLGDYRPGRWAWVLTDPHRCQDRCPNPDCERGVIDLTQPHRGGPWQWQLCPVCAAPGGQVPGDGRCDPIPTRGAQGVWEWPLSRGSQPGEPAS